MERTDLKKIDYIVLGLYLIIGLLIFIFYYQNIFPQKTINESVLAFGFGFPFLLYGLYYKRLRNVKVIAIWSLIALFQIGIYLKYKQNSDFISTIGSSYLEYLMMLPILIIILSLLRYWYWLIYKQELVITSLNFRAGEIVENRKLRGTDFAFSIIGISIMIFGIDFVIELIN